MIDYIDEYNEKLIKICKENPTSYMNMLRSNKYSYLYNYVLNCVSGFLNPSNSTFGKMINWVINKYQDFPICKTEGCGKRVIGPKQIRFNEEWTQHCCNRCAQSDTIIKTRIKDIKAEKYGDPNYNGDLEETKRKNRIKYGCDWYVQSEEFKRKAKETWINNGYDHPMHSSTIKKQMGDRYEEKHGVRYSVLNRDVVSKSRAPYFYDNLYFKSSWELALYIYLRDNDIDFKYQPEISIRYEDNSGKEHFYFPDFMINNELVEIKGDQFKTSDNKLKNPYDITGETNPIYEAKRICMEKNNVRVLYGKDIVEYIRYCDKKFNSTKWKNLFRTIKDDIDITIKRNDGNLIKELTFFKNKNVKTIPKNVGSYNYIIKYFQQDTFFRKEKELWKDKSIRNRIIDNRKKYTCKKTLDADDILTGFKKSGIYYGYSHFNPLWFKWFIQKYDVKSCYDPCGGWGHRLLGGLNLQKYIYNDLSKTTKENVDRIIDYFGITNTITYNNDALNFSPSEEFDAMFTCPPYFNVEEYECGRIENIDEYNKLIISLYDLFKNKEKCKIFGLVIREDLLPCQMNDYISKIDIISYRKSYLSNNLNSHKEHMYIFRK